jgi:hypothetical protein
MRGSVWCSNGEGVKDEEGVKGWLAYGRRGSLRFAPTSSGLAARSVRGKDRLGCLLAKARQGLAGVSISGSTTSKAGGRQNGRESRAAAD